MPYKRRWPTNGWLSSVQNAGVELVGGDRVQLASHPAHPKTCIAQGVCACARVRYRMRDPARTWRHWLPWWAGGWMGGGCHFPHTTHPPQRDRRRRLSRPTAPHPPHPPTTTYNVYCVQCRAQVPSNESPDGGGQYGGVPEGQPPARHKAGRALAVGRHRPLLRQPPALARVRLLPIAVRLDEGCMMLRANRQRAGVGEVEGGGNSGGVQRPLLLAKLVLQPTPAHPARALQCTKTMKDYCQW